MVTILYPWLVYRGPDKQVTARVFLIGRMRDA